MPGTLLKCRETLFICEMEMMIIYYRVVVWTIKKIQGSTRGMVGSTVNELLCKVQGGSLKTGNDIPFREQICRLAFHEAPENRTWRVFC